MSAHSNLGPSSAERWWNCPGSVALTAKLPPAPTSFAAAEGSVAHTLAEELVTGKVDEIDLLDRVGETVEQEGHEIEITDEMVDGAVEYRDIIVRDRKALTRMGRPAPIVAKAEVKVHAKTMGKDLWGTADFILYQKGNALTVYDYKFGKGVLVEVEGNKQTLIYLIAAMESEAGQAFDRIETVIVQPRAPHTDGIERRWVVPKEKLVMFHEGLKAAVKATEDPKAPLIAGAWCRWCPAKVECPAMYAAVQKSAAVDFSVVPSAAKPLDILPDTRIMPIEKLALALDWEDAINSWYEALRLRVREILENGGDVPGYKLVDGKSNRRWISEGAVEAHFGAKLGEKLWEKKLLSPAKLEKIVGKKELAALNLTEKPEAAKSIAKNTDPRPVARSSAAEDFALLADGKGRSFDIDGVLDPSKKMWP